MDGGKYHMNRLGLARTWGMGVVLLGAASAPMAQVSITYPSETEFTSAPRQCPLNGHWYAVGKIFRTWEDNRTYADNARLGTRYRAHLATFTSHTENDWARQFLLFSGGPVWIGGRQKPNQAKDQGWYWVTGEAWDFTNWGNGEPNESGTEDALEYITSYGLWNDLSHQVSGVPLVEFDQPLQTASLPFRDWRTRRAYRVVEKLEGWEAARTAAARRDYLDLPGHLATLTSVTEENTMLVNLAESIPSALWVGGRRVGSSTDPAAGWTWITGEPWEYTHWAAGEPEDATFAGENVLAWRTAPGQGWSDEISGRAFPYLVEYELPWPQPGQNAVLGFDGHLTGGKVVGSASFVVPASFTVELWVRPEIAAQPMQMLVSNAGGRIVGTQGFSLYALDDGLEGWQPAFSIAGVGLVQSTQSLPFAQWHHVAAVRDGAGMFLYADGQRVAALQGKTGPVVDSAAPIMVGLDGVGGGYRFLGVLDELRIWTRARGAEEIGDAYSEYLPAGQTDLFLYYPVTADDHDTVRDHGPGGHDLIQEQPGVAAELAPLVLPGQLQLGAPLNLALSVAITPQAPTAWDNLLCQVNIQNFGNHQLETSYQWLRNGQALTQPLAEEGQVQTTTGPVLSHAYLRRGDRLACRVRVSEGPSFRLRTTSEVVVRNATPSTPEVHIVPDDPQPWDGLGVEFLNYSVDPDGDAIGYEINWYRSQNGGVSFIYRIELSGILPQGNWVPPAFLKEGDIWRVEAVPFEIVSALKGAGGSAEAVGEGLNGTPSWDQVYIGENTHPTVEILEPAGGDVMALRGVRVAWRASDPDGDPVTVGLWYRDRQGSGAEHVLALDLPANGSLLWTPPTGRTTPLSPDFNMDGRTDFLDALRLGCNWALPAAGPRYRIIARAFDSHLAVERVQGQASVVAPEEYPMESTGLLEMFDGWHAPR